YILDGGQVVVEGPPRRHRRPRRRSPFLSRRTVLDVMPGPRAMAITPRLDLRQTQSLVMTPQLQQAIKLLQLSNLEVPAYVEREIEQTPLLERDETHVESEPNGKDRPNGEADGNGSAEPKLLDSVDGGGKDSTETPLDTDFGNVWSEEGGDASAFADWRTGNGGGRTDFDDSEIGLDQTLSREVSLRDHLLAQLNVEIVDPVDRIIATHLIDMLDESGYLTGDAAQVAEMLNCDVARVETTLDKLQR